MVMLWVMRAQTCIADMAHTFLVKGVAQKGGYFV
jgi:hypothetical protein